MIKYCPRQGSLFDIETVISVKTVINDIKDFLRIGDLDLLVVFDNQHRNERGQFEIARTISGSNPIIKIDCVREFKFEFVNGYIMIFCPCLSECSQIEREWVVAHEFGHLLDAMTKPATYEIGIRIQNYLVEANKIPNNHMLPLEKSADLTAKRIILSKYTSEEFSDLMHSMSTTILRDSWELILMADIANQYNFQNAIVELYRSNRAFLSKRAFSYNSEWINGDSALEKVEDE